MDRLPKPDFLIKRNDTLPSIKVDILARGLLNEIIPFDLSSMTSVTFTMRDVNDNYKIYSKSAETICASGGTIQYNWKDGDTNKPGRYFGEFEMMFAPSGKMSYPSFGSLDIIIVDDLNS